MNDAYLFADRQKPNAGNLRDAVAFFEDYIKEAERLGDVFDKEPNPVAHYRAILAELIRLQAQHEEQPAFEEFWIVWGPLYRISAARCGSINEVNREAEQKAREHPGEVFYSAKVLARVVALPARLQWEDGLPI